MGPFFPADLDRNARRIPDYAKMRKELAKSGVTLAPFVGRILGEMLFRRKSTLLVDAISR